MSKVANGCRVILVMALVTVLAAAVLGGLGFSLVLAISVVMRQ